MAFSVLRSFAIALACGAAAVLPIVSCSGNDETPPPKDAGPDVATTDAPPAPPLDGACGVGHTLPDAGEAEDVNVSGATYCSLPGSIVSNGRDVTVVGGGDSHCVETWLNLPAGFCAHFYATVPYARQVKFAPGGDLFVASPGTPTTGGGNNGLSQIVVLPDDDKDGVADALVPFMPNLPTTQGMMFANGFFYYQDGTAIRRVAFKPGDRTPSGATEMVTQMNGYTQATEHWPKVFDVAQDGTIYITNGATQGETCLSTRPFFGGIVKLNGDGTTTPVAKGFRNPIAIKCEKDKNVCLAVELALDYSQAKGGREKVLPVRQGDDWGFPCCGTKDVPYDGVTYQDIGGVPDCSGIAQESASFIIGHTPFGIDIEPGAWPAPWGGRAFVTLHGDFSTWFGARMVALALDPQSGLPLPSSELDGGPGNDAMLEFASGWDDHQNDHGRPAAVTFAPDGRMFLADDYAGVIMWIAPVGLMRK